MQLSSEFLYIILTELWRSLLILEKSLQYEDTQNHGNAVFKEIHINFPSLLVIEQVNLNPITCLGWGLRATQSTVYTFFSSICSSFSRSSGVCLESNHFSWKLFIFCYVTKLESIVARLALWWHLITKGENPKTTREQPRWSQRRV